MTQPKALGPEIGPANYRYARLNLAAAVLLDDIFDRIGRSLAGRT
jgi:hypothetical protein